MRKLFLMSTALIGLATLPVYAEDLMASTQMPPSPNSSEAGLQPHNSLPPTAETSDHALAGSRLGYAAPMLGSVPPVMADAGRVGPGRIVR